MSKFTEAKLEQAFIELLGNEGFPHFFGNTISRADDEVLIEKDLKTYLLIRYKKEKLTEIEARSIILQLKTLSSTDLYESNKKIMRWLADGFILKREDRKQKDIHIELIDYAGLDAQRKSNDLDFVAAEKETPKYGISHNIYKFVNQLEIVGTERRIPDGIIYINGLPIVVFEFKSAIREEATIHNAFEQLTIRYKRDIPELFKYNAFCVISDGVNNKAGSFFAPYEFYYAWRRIAGLAKDLPVPRPLVDNYCIYVLKCSDGSFYKGQTNNLKRRLEEHNKGNVSWTSKNLPVELIHWEYFYTKDEAVKREKELKSGFGRKWLKEKYAKKQLAKWTPVCVSRTGRRQTG